MQVVREDIVFGFDVDDTLVYWGRGPVPAEDFEVECPASRFRRTAEEQGVDDLPPTEEFSVGSWKQVLHPNKPVIEKLKWHHSQGHAIVVWTQGGHDWAEAVIKGLKLEDYVHFVFTKFAGAYDDLPMHEWMHWIKVK